MFPPHVHFKAKCWHPTLHFRSQGRLPLAQVYCWHPASSVVRQFSILHFFRSPMNLLPSAVHVSSNFESGAPQSYCVALFANSPFSTFFQSPMNSLPCTVHASSTIESGAPRSYCAALFTNSPFSTLFGDPWIYCLALFMCPPPSNLEPREVIA